MAGRAFFEATYPLMIISGLGIVAGTWKHNVSWHVHRKVIEQSEQGRKAIRCTEFMNELLGQLPPDPKLDFARAVLVHDSAADIERECGISIHPPPPKSTEELFTIAVKDARARLGLPPAPPAHSAQAGKAHADKAH